MLQCSVTAPACPQGLPGHPTDDLDLPSSPGPPRACERLVMAHHRKRKQRGARAGSRTGYKYWKFFGYKDRRLGCRHRDKRAKADAADQISD